MKKVVLIAGAVLVSCICWELPGATWYVDGSVAQPGDGQSWERAFKLIQAAIYGSSDGDTIIVAPGTYAEGVHFDGKNVVLRSTDPLDAAVVANTIIDGQGSVSPVRFSGDENETCVLSGFTLRKGGSWTGHGGGILGGTEENHTHATVRNNVITQNSATLFGGGVAYCDGVIENNTISFNSAYDGGGLSDCGGLIRNNIIRSNAAEYKGGGLFNCDGLIEGNEIEANTVDSQGGGLIHCDGTLKNNTISKNSATWGAGTAYCGGLIQGNLIIENSASDSGGGLAGCDGTVRSNVVGGNTARLGAGLHACKGSVLNNTIIRNSTTDAGSGLFLCSGTIANCIVWGFVGDTGAHLAECSTPTHSCIQNWTGGGEANIVLDPRFADPNGPDDTYSSYKDNDYRLLPDSPCIDEGTNSVLNPPGLDMDGNLRIARWKYPIVAIVDMGAYEFNSSPFAVSEFGFTDWPPPGGRYLVWNSQPNDTYRIWSTYTLSGEWYDVGTASSEGETTSFTATGLLPWGWRGLLYRVEMD